MAYDFYKGELLLVHKPYTWSSFQAVNKIKHAIKNHPSLLVDGVKTRAKIGHAGTLDPLATGLLILATGKKTKSLQSLMGLEKEYTGKFHVGATTPCFDLEKPVDHTFPISHLNEKLILETAGKFIGKQLQVPPVFSAIMVEGKRAYDLARKGQQPELLPREIEISEFEITEIALPEIAFRLVCSKGTYIRSLARDFGLALNSGAYLSALCRTRIGGFRLNDAVDPVTFSESLKQDQMLR